MHLKYFKTFFGMEVETLFFSPANVQDWREGERRAGRGRGTCSAQKLPRQIGWLYGNRLSFVGVS